MNAHDCARDLAVMRPAPTWTGIALIAGALVVSAPARGDVSAADAAQGIVEFTASQLNNHNPNLAENPDRLICFQAYVSNFNTQPRQIGSKPNFLGVPHWVAHHIVRAQ